jgi:hypothetical protein
MLHPRLRGRLALRDAPVPGRAAHLSAASGLVALGAHLYVVADDELQLARFAPDGSDGELLPLFAGTLPPDYAARKAAKPDFEALLHLPPEDAADAGCLIALGSGSTAHRSRAACLALDRAGAPIGPAREFDLSQLHARLRVEFAALNLEGALVRGDELVLLQRASALDRRNALLRVPLQALRDALGTGAFALPSQLAIDAIELGERDGVSWGLTDGTALVDGRVLFSAVLEDSVDTYADGACAGSALGLLAPDGRVLAFEPLAPRCKIEGVCMLRQGAALELRLVTDADDAQQAAQLFALDWRPG